jgi:hypothetical protein
MAAPFIDHLEPPVLEQGKPTRVAFVGTGLDQALDVWHTGPAGTLRTKILSSTPTRTIAELTATGPVGIGGLRLATRNGLSNAHLFLIDDLPRRTGPALTLPACVVGTFREGEVERYTITVNAGQTLSMEVVASRLAKNADPVVTIRNAQGKRIAEYDNDQGLHYDCRFAHEFAHAGTYTIEVRDSRYHGSPHHLFVLRVGQFPAARVALPNALGPGTTTLHFPEQPGLTATLLPPHEAQGPFTAAVKRAGDEGSIWLPLTLSDTVRVARERQAAYTKAAELATAPATSFAFNLTPWRVNPFVGVDRLLLTGRMQATLASVPGVWCGVLTQPVEQQGFVFDMAKGQTIYLRAEAKSLQSPADLEMILTDRVGRELRRAQEVREERHLDFTAPVAGQYGVLLRDQLRDGGAAFTYRITARELPFPPTLVADVEGLTIPQGSYQPVPLVVTRTGTTGTIKLELRGAPPGLTLTPNEIGAKDNAVVCRLQATTDTPQGVYAVQVRALTSAGPTLVRTQPLLDKQLVNVDLIPLALRDDQKQLPPELADRLAVQITPPAPFDVEVGEATITLPRYQEAPIPLTLRRCAGYTDAITFTAKGGQLAPKTEGRTRVYAEFPTATGTTTDVRGSIHSKILSNLGNVRVDVNATGRDGERTVTLTRTFELNLTTAYQMTTEPSKQTVAPGATVHVRVQATRVPTFTGAITLKLPTIPGLTLPETLTLPAGQSAAMLTVQVAPDANPTRYNIQAHAHGAVGGFEEEIRVTLLELDVRHPEAPKKK